MPPPILVLEETEARAFDALVERRFGDMPEESLRIPDETIARHVSPTRPPITAHPFALHQLPEALIRDRLVLNLCCGVGVESVLLASKGARVVAVDISRASVTVAQRRARAHGLERRISSQVQSAYDLAFPDGAFSFVLGNACLHHLDIERAMTEVCRVLAPGGRAVFCEPYAGSRTLESLRTRVPVPKNKVSPHERPLDDDDLARIRRVCGSLEVHRFGLFNRVDRVCRRPGLLRVVERFDQRLLGAIPPLAPFARSVVLTATRTVGGFAAVSPAARAASAAPPAADAQGGEIAILRDTLLATLGGAAAIR